ncbi:MAG: D-2-hydroxyacid dehydrogenase [Erysipelotrichaceae bacterium]|nr:D-2-hydroxyacid dehydrogenase [Erysipelotrichaceae bacterium]
MKENVLAVLPTLTEEQINTLRQLCEDNDYAFNLALNNQEAEPYLDEATIIYGGSSWLISHAPKLKWFHSVSAGVNSYIPVIKEDTLLTNSAGAFGLSISEHIIMVILMMLRRMPEYQKRIAVRSWQKGLEQESIYGKRITVVGTGDIGSHFAERVRAFHPDCITGVSRSGRDNPFFDEVYSIAEIDHLLPATDILVSCVPETPETIGYINRERLMLLPDTAYLVNVGRGSAVVEEDLIDILNSGLIAGAALDVFCTEPLPEDSPLYDIPNLIITPHCSGNLTLDYTKETNFNMFLNNLKHYIGNEPLEHVVNKRLGY